MPPEEDTYRNVLVWHEVPKRKASRPIWDINTLSKIIGAAIGPDGD